MMNEEKFKRAFDRIRPSEGQEKVILENVLSEAGHVPKKRPQRKVWVAATAAMLAICLCTVTAYAFGGIDYFRSLFGEDYYKVEGGIVSVGTIVQGEDIDMTVDSVLCDGRAATIIVKLEGTSEYGKKILAHDQWVNLIQFELEAAEWTGCICYGLIDMIDDGTGQYYAVLHYADAGVQQLSELSIALSIRDVDLEKLDTWNYEDYSAEYEKSTDELSDNTADVTVEIMGDGDAVVPYGEMIYTQQFSAVIPVEVNLDTVTITCTEDENRYIQSLVISPLSMMTYIYEPEEVFEVGNNGVYDGEVELKFKDGTVLSSYAYGGAMGYETEDDAVGANRYLTQFEAPIDLDELESVIVGGVEYPLD